MRTHSQDWCCMHAARWASTQAGSTPAIGNCAASGWLLRRCPQALPRTLVPGGPQCYAQQASHLPGVLLVKRAHSGGAGQRAQREAAVLPARGESLCDAVLRGTGHKQPAAWCSCMRSGCPAAQAKQQARRLQWLGLPPKTEAQSASMECLPRIVTVPWHRFARVFERRLTCCHLWRCRLGLC